MKKYKFTFKHNSSIFLTEMYATVHGDMRLQQKKNNRLTNVISFSQESERFLFISLLRYFHQFEKGLDYIRDGKKGLLAKIRQLPNLKGNFEVGFSRDTQLREDFSRFLIPIINNPKRTHNLSHEGYITSDKNANLYFHQNFLNFTKKKYKPLIFTPESVKKLMYGIAYLAANGIVRTSKGELEERIRYFNSDKFIEVEERMKRA